MAAKRIYLDYNASAPLLPSARSAMNAALDLAGNASSVHAEGRVARRLVEDARRDVGAMGGVDAANVVFTSGATEALSWLLSPSWTMGRAEMPMARLIVCAADHPATLKGGHFPADRVSTVGVDDAGIIRLADLEHLLAQDAEGVALVAVHFANNETGVVQPHRDIAEIARRAGAVLVWDAVQAAGRMPLDLIGMGDFLVLSSHKIGGPQGAGAILSAGGALMPMPLVLGGGQERGHRAGTENVAALAGFGAAARESIAGLADVTRISELRNRFEAAVLEALPDAFIFSRGVPRLPNTVFFAVPGMRAENLQIAFDLEGIALSAGSACSSGKTGPSHVLAAMRQGHVGGAIRVSIGGGTTEADLAGFSAALGKIAGRRVASVRAA